VNYPVKSGEWQVASGALALRSAVGSGTQILDRDDVQTVQRHDLTIAVDHRKGARGDQDHLRMADGIFAAVRGAQRKRVKSAARNALANSFQIHARSVSLPRCPVKRVDDWVVHSALAGGARLLTSRLARTLAPPRCNTTDDRLLITIPAQ